MRSRTIAIAGSIAALSFAAAPIAQAASTTHHPPATRRASTARVTRAAFATSTGRRTDQRRSLHGRSRSLMTRPPTRGGQTASCPPRADARS